MAINLTHNGLDRQSLICRIVNRNWNFTGDSSENGLFNLHPYPTKFIPQIPRAFIKDVGVLNGGVVFDPFCGSGTTLIEAQSLGYESFGIDLNPIACLISRVATSERPHGYDDSVVRCLERAQSIDNLPEVRIPRVDHWFKKPIQKAISSITNSIERESCESTRDILLLALSSIIVRISNQESDTRYAAIEKNNSASDVFKLFQKVCEHYGHVLRNNDEIVPTSKILCKDILTVSPRDFPSPVGLVICSPPYPNAYETWLYHKYRMWWLGYDPLYVKEREIGARPHYYKKNRQTPEDFFKQMVKLFLLLSEVCLDSSYACFILGDSKIHGKIIDNTTLLCEAASQYNFEPIAILSRDIALSRKAFNIANSRARSEEIIIFQKQRRQWKAQYKSINFRWHDYNYMPYEKRLALRELSALPTLRVIQSRNSGVFVQLQQASVKNIEKLVYVKDFNINKGEIHRTLQAKLENRKSENTVSRRQSTRYGVHGLHEYKGKFNPQVVRSILNAYKIEPGGKVLDPFCGSGTALIESAIAGCASVGLDINPLAVHLSNTKIKILKTDPGRLKSIAKNIVKCYDSGIYDTELEKTDRLDYLAKWVPHNNLKSLENFRNIILDISGDLAPFFLLVLSDLIREYSLQEPADLRIRRRRSPMPAISLREQFERILINKIESVKTSYDVLSKVTTSAIAYYSDARDWPSLSKHGIVKESFDFAITSPPYATALPYIDTQRLSLIWLDLLETRSIREKEEQLIGNREVSKEKLRVLFQDLEDNSADLPLDVWSFCMMLKEHLSESDGFRRQAVPALLYKYFNEMMHTFGAIRQAIKSGGLYSLIIGGNRTTLGGDQFYIDTPSLLSKVAEHQKWEIIELLSLETYKRFGLHSANAVNTETLLVIKK